jgi:hypothetical protein
VCMLICTLASGGLDVVVNPTTMQSWARQLLLRPIIKESCILHYYHTNSGPSLSRVVPHEEGTICTLVSGGMDGCMYVNMYIGIW